MKRNIFDIIELGIVGSTQAAVGYWVGSSFPDNIIWIGISSGIAGVIVLLIVRFMRILLSRDGLLSDFWAYSLIGPSEVIWLIIVLSGSCIIAQMAVNDISGRLNLKPHLFWYMSILSGLIYLLVGSTYAEYERYWYFWLSWIVGTTLLLFYVFLQIGFSIPHALFISYILQPYVWLATAYVVELIHQLKQWILKKKKD